MRKKIKYILSSISPELTTRLMYYYNFKKALNLQHPTTFNEKIQYLKLKTYNNSPTITRCVDKWRVRAYLEERGYASLLPKLYYGGITEAEQIKQYWQELPDRLVIKCNHGCGYNILVKDKANTDLI